MVSAADLDPGAVSETLALSLLAEAVVITRRKVAGDTVRVATVTHEREQLVDEALTRERVEIERVPIGRTVEAVPPVREEGDTTVVPVVEEVVVVERRLVLKEEIRVRRVRGTEHHRESVVLRTQDAVITRIGAGPQTAGDARRPLGTDRPSPRPGAATMTEQTIVAVYDTAAHADAAIRDLEAAHVPSDAISRHAQGTTAGATTDAAAPPAREPGFWASLFGGESSDTPVLARSVEGGATVVTVKAPEQHVARVSDILDRHDPIDFDECAASYGMAQTTAATATSAAPRAAAMPVAAVETEDGGTIRLAAEMLTVGKRAVNRGTTRVRRYVVETPVEEQVTLHSETVHVDRRPVTDGRPVTAADFDDRTIEMRETSEEAVVGKTARVVEEISLRKEGVDRVETVRDTVRRQEVEIEEVPAAATAVETAAATAKAAGKATPPARSTKV